MRDGENGDCKSTTSIISIVDGIIVKNQFYSIRVP
jgi:hypothetical protein